MRARTWLRAASVTLWLVGSGCTSLHEIPRGEFSLKPERERVRVVTRDGLVYEFDSARVSADSLYGFRRRENVEGDLVEEFATVPLSLADVERLSIRGVDWTRTGMIAGGALAALVAIGLVRSSQDNRTESSGGGKITPP
jgi:hypothetical protein